MQSETTDVLFARYGARLRWYATGTVMLGMISAVLTTTIVNVAIPDIMGAYGIGQDKAQWLATGALAAMTIGMLSNAWLVKSFGERRTFVVGLMIFTSSLMVAGTAPNENVLIGARICQGAVAGIMQPLSMYVMFRVFPPDQRGMAMGFFGMSVILGPALGPTLGGILIDAFNWRYIFFAAVPATFAGMLLGNIFLPQREATGKRPDFDFVGFALLATAIGSLLTGLSNGQREGWDSNFVIVLVFLSMGCGAGFIWWELRARQPLVELRVLGNGQFTAAASVAFIFGLGLFGTTYLVPLFVQLIQKYTPLAAGLLLMPGGLILGAFMPIAGFMSDRAPPRTMIMAGLVCFGVSTFLMAAVDANMSFWTIAWLVVLSRIGLALIKPSLNLAALRPLRPEQVTQGAGMINFARQLGGAFGVNALSVTLDRRTMLHSEAFTSTQSAANSATAELLHQTQALLAQAGVSPDAQAAGALHYLGRVLTAQAYTAGFQDSFLLCGFIFTAALIPAWIMGMRRRAPPAQAA